MKTYKNWTSGDLDHYLNIGDEVDQEMIDYIIGCLPPRTMNSDIVQLGEPYSHEYDAVKGCYRATFATFVSNGLFAPARRWFYAGNCFSGAKDMQEFILEFIGWTKPNTKGV